MYIQNQHLEHYGVLGMRWGIRRYQPYSIKPRGSGKKGEEIGILARDKKRSGKRLSRKEKLALEERERAKREVVEKRQQEEFKKQRFEEKRDYLRRQGSASEVLQYQEMFSDQDLQSIVNRLRSREALQKMTKSEAEKTFDTIDKIMKKANTVSEWGDTGIKLYNQIAAVYNATEKGQKDPMSLVGKGGGKKKKKGDDD